MKLHEVSQKTLTSLGIENLNEMQVAAHRAIQEESELVLLAPTGSGKTLAFLLPILNLLNPNDKGIQSLILTPSRELALQIEQVWKKMSTGFKVNTCYGGHSVQVEMQNLTESPAVLVGTPGRIYDHLTRRSIDISATKLVVLDEFDKSLTMGFEEEMSFIMSFLKSVEKKILVSATSKITIPSFTKINSPLTLDYTKTEEKSNDALISKTVYSSIDKTETLFKLLCHLGAESTIVFCNLRESTEETCRFLQSKGLDAAFFHGKMEQIDREKTLVNFRNGSITFLVATDLAARGLDIPAVKNVVHLELPFHKEELVHRNGRTARMNAEGTSYLLMHENETKPNYIDFLPDEIRIPSNTSLPPSSKWSTLYVSGGKKDKLSKIDIVGFLSKKGNLEKNDIGLIEVMDFMSFVAINKNKVKSVLELVRNEKMKGQKYKIEIAR